MDRQMDDALINVAATCQATRALGPGLRAAVWVQGCIFNCPGCIAPDWIPIRPANLIDPVQLAGFLLQNPAIEGLTISGGEPMLQATGLSKLVRAARKIRPVNVICFSGFHLAHLVKSPPDPGVSDFLEGIDVLIDGPYIQRFNDDQGLRGSSNQVIHYLSDRLKPQDLANTPRKTEIMVQDGSVMMVGIPTRSGWSGFDQAVHQAYQMMEKGTMRYERA